MKVIAGILFFIFITPGAWSQSAMDSLEHLLRSATDTTGVNELNELIWAKIGKNNNEAINIAHHTIKLSKELNYQKGLANAYNYLGVVFQNTSDYDSSLYYLENAFQIYDQLNMESAASGSLNNIGVTLLYQGDFDQALEYFYRALSTKEKFNDKQSLISIYNNIGIIHAYHQNNDKALEYYLRSLEAAGNESSSLMVANTLNNVGLIYHDKENYELAMDYYNKSLETHQRINNKKGMAAIFQNIASVQRSLGKIDQSEQSIKKALAIDTELGDFESMARSYSGLGNIYFDKGQYRKSISYLEKSLEKSMEIGTLGQTVNALREISRCYEKLGNTDRAFNYYKQYKLFEDSLFSAESDKNIAELREKYEAEKREQEILQLNFDAELNDIKMRNQRFWLIVSISGLIIFAVLMLIMLIQRNQKNKAYKDLVIKNLENIEIEKKLQTTQHENKTVPVTESTVAESTEDNQKYRTSMLEEVQKKQLLEKIKSKMETEQLFLEPDLTIEKLAAEININKRYISQVINELKNQNFSSYLNEYRVREARKLLLDPEHRHLTIESIAGMVGFNSKSAFNSAFKKFTGVTPSFFIKNSYKA